MNRTVPVLGSIAGLLVLLAVGAFSGGYQIYIANLLLVFIVLSLGLHVVIGEAGQFALAHAAFYGIGIYVAALTTNAWGLPFPLPILAAGLVAGLIGIGLGAVALRMRDIYLALATFAFGEAMQWVFSTWTGVTGGPNGLHISPTRVFGITILNDTAAYPLVAALTVLMVAIAVLLSRSRAGRSFRAVRESEVAAVAMGVPVRRTKIAAFAISAAFAGVAGGMFSIFSTYINPDSLGFQTTITVLTMVVVGGLGSIFGAVSGAILFGLASEFLRQAPSYQEIIYGGILMFFMMFAPRGFFSGIADRLEASRRG